MDPAQLQVESLRDHDLIMRIKAKTNPKPLNNGSWLYNFHAVVVVVVVVLPLSVIILLVPYFLPALVRCYFCPVGISCANLVGLLAGKKLALFLFSNFIFILLVVDFTLSSPSNSFTSTLRNDDNSASLQGVRRLPSDSNAILVGDAPAAAEQLHDGSPWISSSLQVEEGSKTNIHDIFFGDFLTENIGDRLEWRLIPEYSNKSQQGRLMKAIERGNNEVVVVDDAVGTERTSELEAFGIEDELEHLELEELNRKFDEFIARKKNKWRSEALQLVMAL